MSKSDSKAAKFVCESAVVRRSMLLLTVQSMQGAFSRRYVAIVGLLFCMHWLLLTFWHAAVSLTLTAEP